MPTIEQRYHEKFGGSRDWHERGKSLFAGGVTHQTRFTSPFPVYIEHAEGPYKYDVDGNQIIDYVMGNGSLLMGHSPPGVTEAVIAAASNGTHLGGGTTYEVRYAEAVKRLIPSLERVRFTSSGTESTLLAMRLAPCGWRAATRARTRSSSSSSTSTAGTTTPTRPLASR